MKLVGLLLLMLASVSCRTLGILEESRTPQQEQAALPSSASKEEVDRKFAEMWARMDELNTALTQQKQRIRVLEKGLVLGLLPDELKHESELSLNQEAKRKVSEASPILTSPELTTSPVADVSAAVAQIKSDDDGDYLEKMGKAQSFFERGQYGRAIAIYSSINGDYDGSHRYWMGLSWLKLKEYDTARREFTDFIAKYEESAWIPRAMFYLATIDLEQGLRDNALSKLRDIIDRYPGEDAAQMARASLAKMEQNL